MELADGRLLHDRLLLEEADTEIHQDRAYLALDMVHLAAPGTTYSGRSPR